MSCTRDKSVLSTRRIRSREKTLTTLLIVAADIHYIADKDMRRDMSCARDMSVMRAGRVRRRK